MNILAVDDEPLMLWQLTENLKRIFEKPEYRVSGFDEVNGWMHRRRDPSPMHFWISSCVGCQELNWPRTSEKEARRQR